MLSRRHLLITGAEKCGKTVLAKRLLMDLRDSGRVPLLIGARSIPEHGGKLEKALTDTVHKQYGADAGERYWQLFPHERAVIVDGYDHLGMSAQGRDELIHLLEKRFEIVVVIGAEDDLINDLAGPERETRAIWAYERLSMLELSQLGRYELVRKWIGLGRDPSEDERAVYRETVHIHDLIGMLLLRNLLPSQPYLVLMLLQQLEAKTPITSSYGSYGHLYEFIIKARLARVSGSNAELEGHLTYLSEMAFRLHARNLDTVPEKDFRAWHDEYCAAFARRLDYGPLVSHLAEEEIVDRRHGQIGFRYRYYRNFFLARHIANHLDDDADTRELVEQLAASLHLRDAGDTMMFLCHLSKNRFVVQSVLAVGKRLFEDIDPYDLTATPKIGVDANIGHPALTLNNDPPEQNRMRLLEAADEAERSEQAPRDASESTSISLRIEDSEKEALDLASRMHSAHKTVQIIGQIVRNFYGSLKADEQKELVDTCYALGLRVLGAILGLLARAEGLREQFSTVMQARRPSLKGDELNEHVSRLLYVLTQSIAFGSVKHISNSVGLAQLSITLDRVVRDVPTPSHRIIDLSVRLDHFDEFPLPELKAVLKDLHHSYFAMGLMRFLVWHHFYVFPEDFRLIQSVCSDLKIQLPPDRFLNPTPKRIASSTAKGAIASAEPSETR